MVKYLIISHLLLIFAPLNLLAQSKSIDSSRLKGTADARNFKLNKADLKVFRKNRNNSTSDYFKPVDSNASQTRLLKDSTYVKAFRAEAYKKTKKRRTVGHYLAWVGIGYGTAVVVTYL